MAAARFTSGYPSSRRYEGGGFARLAGVGVVLVLILGIIAVVAVVTGFDRTQGGEVAVIRNGGLLDNHKVRQVVEPASALTWTGMWSQSHKYPAQQRFYTITSDKQGG